MIDINNLEKSFGNQKVLTGISTTIEKGEIYGLVGSSGAGKSTLLRCINGLVYYDSGSLKVDGVEIKDLSKNGIREMRSNIGMIFQDFSLVSRMNVFQNIAMPMKCWGYSDKEIEQRVNELLSMINLESKREFRPTELSGGQQQRVAIARAIALKPKVLLCDEATSALDPNTASNILDLIKKVNIESGITVVIVAHQMSVVKQVCDRISILEQGVIKSSGKVSDVFLEYPDSLKNLLGEDYEKILPKEGYNLKLEFSGGDNESKTMSELAINTNIPYSYVWGGIDAYKEELTGLVIINIKTREDLIIVSNYLKLKNIRHRGVGNEIGY